MKFYSRFFCRVCLASCGNYSLKLKGKRENCDFFFLSESYCGTDQKGSLESY